MSHDHFTDRWLGERRVRWESLLVCPSPTHDTVPKLGTFTQIQCTFSRGMIETSDRWPVLRMEGGFQNVKWWMSNHTHTHFHLDGPTGHERKRVTELRQHEHGWAGLAIRWVCPSSLSRWQVSMVIGKGVWPKNYLTMMMETVASLACWWVLLLSIYMTGKADRVCFAVD